MFRLWCKIFDEGNHLLRDVTIENNDSNLNRTKKIFNSLEEASYQLDLEVPIWLDANIRDFKRSSKVRFNQDNFIAPINFAYLEIQVIEED